MKRSGNRRRPRGFTLVEMLVVLAILVLLVSMVVPRIIGSQKKADLNAAKTQIGMYKAALERYAIDCKGFPTTEQGLRALVEKPADLDENVAWDGPYVSGDIGLDPWGNEYQYECEGDDPRIWSFGPDREDNTADDVTSWGTGSGGAAGTGEERSPETGREPRRETTGPSRSTRDPGSSTVREPSRSTPREPSRTPERSTPRPEKRSGTL